MIDALFSSNKICVDSMYKIVFLNNNSLISFFKISMFFFVFACHIRIATSCRILLNRNVKNEHSCLIFSLRGNTFIVTSLKIGL